MDPLDEEPDRPARQLPYVRLQQRVQRLLQDLGETPDRVRRWDDEGRSTSFVPTSESVVIDVRRHAFLLIWPGLRTVLGLLALAAGFSLPVLVLFAAVTAVWTQVRLRAGLRRTALIAAAATAALVVVPAAAGAIVGLLLLLLWAAEDVADWWCDRLVVTDRRIYRRYGVLTQHSPSIALTAIAFIDAAVPPVGRLLRYGTLRLDSVAQRDAPLARLDLVPDVIPVSHEILRLRSLALPKFPQLPH